MKTLQKTQLFLFAFLLALNNYGMQIQFIINPVDEEINLLEQDEDSTLLNNEKNITNKYKCPECDQLCKKPSELFTHLQTKQHNWTKKKTIKYIKTIKPNFVNKTKNFEYVCMTCKKTFKDPNKFRIHLHETHQKTDEEITQSIQKVNPKYLYRKKPRTKNLKSPKKNIFEYSPENGFSCIDCNVLNLKNTLFIKHLKTSVHNITKKDDRIQIIKKIKKDYNPRNKEKIEYKCPVLNCEYNNTKFLQIVRHLTSNNHHWNKEKLDEYIKEKNPNYSYLVYSCDICNKDFFNLGLYRNHMKKQHNKKDNYITEKIKKIKPGYKFNPRN